MTMVILDVTLPLDLPLSHGSRNSTNWTLPNQSKSLIKFGGSPTNTVLTRQLTKFFEQIKNINYRKSTNFFGELKISIVT